MYKVLFVCTGNICRSPTAESVFRHFVEKAGLSDKIAVESAGVIAYHLGEPPDSRASDTAEKRGYSMAGQTASQVKASDFNEFDIILAMDHTHLNSLFGMNPQKDSKARLELFLEFADNFSEHDVPDPYYGGLAGFDIVLDMVEDGSKGLLDYIRTEYL
ncbi:MAG: low molecular weight phosphotyrosine protein phosphatase [Alphaproteobacteria bacterium]|nr:low molecular weight phosphotyrosine protein phosphatase [Alphaproteobacteria bacterium]